MKKNQVRRSQLCNGVSSSREDALWGGWCWRNTIYSLICTLTRWRVNSDWSTIDWSRKFYFDVSKVTGYTQRCDSIDFTTKADRAGQTSVLSKCVSTDMIVRSYSTWRMSVLLRLLCTAFYIYMRAGMPEYSADLNIDDVIYINCYMHVWSNYSNTSVERAHTRLPQLTNCYILLCN